MFVYDIIKRISKEIKNVKYLYNLYYLTTITIISHANILHHN